MSPELLPMTVQYYYHVSPSLSRDQYNNALQLEGSSGQVIRFGIILAQFYVNFSRQKHQIDVWYV